VVTDLELTLRRNGDVRSATAKIVPTLAAGRTPQADVQALVDRYDALSAPLRNTPLGRIAGDINPLVRYLQPTLNGTPVGPPALDRIATTP
jgi:hypothetical protein